MVSIVERLVVDKPRLFRERIKELYTRVSIYDGRRPTMQDLADAVGLHRVVLSRQLNAQAGARLTPQSVRAIVRTLADWGAITTRREAEELLELADCPGFSPAEWQAAPLDLLAPSHEPALEPPVRDVAAIAKHNLPANLSSFVGRSHELAALQRRLINTRLLTIVGPGGVGKTRLLRTFGHSLLDHYADGVWFVDLSHLRDGSLIASVVAAVLGVRESAGQPLLTTLTNHLRERKVLLLLDNCEHLLADCALLCAELLAACPELRIATSSRERLSVPGEAVYRLSPLTLPATDQLAIAEAEAVRLFVARAEAANPDFVLYDGNAAAVAHICQQLDGLPLAIELAAARVGSLSVAEIAARLNDRFRLLTSPSRVVPPRQQTLKASLDWSYELLPEAERVLLCRVAVFAEGWALDAAVAVCSGAGLSQPVVVDALLQLVSKSLVVAQPNGEEMRYRLLETVRQYAWPLNQPAAAAAVQSQHARYFVAFVEQVEAHLRGAAQATWFPRCEQEQANIGQALGWCLAYNRAAALRLVGAFWFFWHVRGYVSAGRGWLEAVLTATADLEGSERLKVIEGAAVLADDAGDCVRANELNQQLLTVYRRLGDREGLARVLNHSGTMAYAAGDLAGSRILIEESLALQRELGNQEGMARQLNNLGVLAEEVGDLATAERLLGESLQLRLALGDQRGAAVSRSNLGLVLHKQGNLAQAHSYYTTALTSLLPIGGRLHMIQPLERLADLAFARGDAGRAVRLLAAVAALRAASDTPVPRSQQAGEANRLAALRHHFSSDDFDAVWTEGAAMSLEAAVGYALNDSSSTSPLPNSLTLPLAT